MFEQKHITTTITNKTQLQTTKPTQFKQLPPRMQNLNKNKNNTTNHININPMQIHSQNKNNNNNNAPFLIDNNNKVKAIFFFCANFFCVLNIYSFCLFVCLFFFFEGFGFVFDFNFQKNTN